MKENVLLTGGGAPGAPGIIKCLRQNKDLIIHTCDVRENVSGKFLSDGFSIIPAANNPNFIQELLLICTSKKIKYLIPIVTRELFEISKNVHLFKEKNIHVLISSFESLQLANDKSALYFHLQKKNICIPNFHVVKNVDEFKKACNDLNYPSENICFKPSVSNGSRGFRILSKNTNDFDLLFNEKPNNTFITYEKTIEIFKENEHQLPELLVLEYLPGEEYTVDCLVQNKKAILCIPRKRTKMNNGISVEGTIEKNEEIIILSKQIIDTLNLNGNIGIQFKKDKHGKFQLLEINPRLQGTTVALLGAGINMPLLGLEIIKNHPINVEKLNIKWGTNFIRFWDEVYY